MGFLSDLDFFYLNYMYHNNLPRPYRFIVILHIFSLYVNNFIL